MATNKKGNNGAEGYNALSDPERDLLSTINGIDAKDYSEALRGTFDLVAMHVDIREREQNWLRLIHRLHELIEPLAGV